MSKAYEQVIHKITRNGYHVKICLAFLMIRWTQMKIPVKYDFAPNTSAKIIFSLNLYLKAILNSVQKNSLKPLTRIHWTVHILLHLSSFLYLCVYVSHMHIYMYIYMYTYVFICSFFSEWFDNKLHTSMPPYF